MLIDITFASMHAHMHLDLITRIGVPQWQRMRTAN